MTSRITRALVWRVWSEGSVVAVLSMMFGHGPAGQLWTFRVGCRRVTSTKPCLFASAKLPVIETLLARHPGDRVLIIGQYLADGGQAHFYTVVARETVDQKFAANRQRFLTEQGYTYTILDAQDLSSEPV